MYFIKTHLKNHKGIVFIYCLIYVLLILFSIAYFRMNFVEEVIHKYFDCLDVVHIVVCILGAFPMVFLAREVFERRKYPYVTLYSYNWARIDNLLTHMLSLIFPAILFGIITGLYRNTELEAFYYKGMLLDNMLQHIVLIFFLASLGFCMGVLLQSYSMAMLIVLGYILIMQYMGLPSVIANMITLDYGANWRFGTGMTFCIGIVLNELGMLMLDRKGR